MSKRIFLGVLAALAACAAPAGATPIAHDEEERAQLGGRVIPEAEDTTDYLQFGANGSEPEAKLAFEYLQRIYPRYVRLTTVAKELGNPDAVSTGQDGIPAGAPGDTGDGHPLYVIVLTDFDVPDAGKEYVSLMFAHSAETCGREGTLRSIEDFAKAAAEGSSERFTDGEGFVGPTHSFTAGDLMRKTKTFIALTSPDGWALGDGRRQYSQDNGAGKNSNRVAPQDGWSYYGDVLDRNGYATATQTEGIAVTQYLRQIRERELDGKPFAAGADMHGPIPSGIVLTHDQGNDPTKLIINQDFAARVKHQMMAVLSEYLGPAGDAYGQTGSVKDLLRQFQANYYQVPGAWAVPLEWVTYGGIWDQLGYTAGSTWGGWMNSDAGLDAPSVSYELNCIISKPWDPATMQLFIDNVRAVIHTTLVRAAAPRTDGIERVDLQGPVGFYETGERVSDRDGNPSPPPAGYPDRPLLRQIPQEPYDVSQTDYVRDLARDLLSTPVRSVTESQLPDRLKRVATLVVSDATPTNTEALLDFVGTGGNLVLTDSALKLLPKLGIGTDADIRRRVGYVGYSDIDLTDPFARGLPNTARQTYDPIGLGMETLMERDAYYEESTDSGTENSAPIWTLARSALDDPGDDIETFRVVATADPPADVKSDQEGAAMDEVSIGVVKFGRGQIAFFGGLLPKPVEANPHWYGLNAYTISFAGQTMLLRALTWKRDGLLPLPPEDQLVVAACGGTQRVDLRLPKLRNGDRYRTVRVTVNGKRATVFRKLLRRGKVRVRVVRKPDRKYTVRVRGRTRKGKKVNVNRIVRTCSSSAAKGRAGAGAIPVAGGAPAAPATRHPAAPRDGRMDVFSGKLAGIGL